MLTAIQRDRAKFGSEHKHVHRITSNCWEMPGTGEKSAFASVKNDKRRFSATINLGHFGSYQPDEIDVHVYGGNLHINCTKDADNSERERPAMQLQRQYRLPDDTDLETVKLKRVDKQVLIDADKLSSEYGRPVSFHICDVTARKNGAIKMIP